MRRRIKFGIIAAIVTMTWIRAADRWHGAPAMGWGATLVLGLLAAVANSLFVPPCDEPSDE